MPENIKSLPLIYSIGHSTRPIGDFIAMLDAQDVKILADIRTIPKSRYNPQYEQNALAASLQSAGIEYLYVKGLGGLRSPRKDTPNTGWRNKSFQGYADYMQTEEFRKNLNNLIGTAKQKPLAMMCAEAVPWCCHRSLVSDALFARSIVVMHIMDAGKASPHKLTSFARMEEERVHYPHENYSLPF
jgi:uncharacterized protein (DUF488 family)